MRPPFLMTCRHCPLVLLPLDIAGNITEKYCCYHYGAAKPPSELAWAAAGWTQILELLHQQPGHGVAVVVLLPGRAASVVATASKENLWGHGAEERCGERHIWHWDSPQRHWKNWGVQMIGGGSAGMSSCGGASCPHHGGQDPCGLGAFRCWDMPIQPTTLCCH